jgi:hypothetical protein
MTLRRLAAACLALCSIVSAASAQREVSRRRDMPTWFDAQGPIPVRAQFPIDLVTLDMTPASAGMPEKGSTSIALLFVHSNTFEITPGHEARATAFDTGAFAPGWDYLVDSETTRASLSLQFQIARRVSLGFEAPFLSHGGGFMDSTIESFHDALSLPQNDRDSQPRDQLDIDLLGGNVRARLNEDDAGLGDATLRVRAMLWEGFSAALTAVIEAKAPTGEVSTFTGSGEWDYGLSLLLTAGKRGHLFHGGLGHQVLGQPASWPFEISDRTSAFAAYEYAPNERWSIVFQLMGATSLLPEQSGYKQDGARAEVAIGFHWRRGPFTVSSGFLENVTTNDNDMDLGIYVGLGWLIGR